MERFTGLKSAAAEELPGARAVMDLFHVTHPAGDALDECRRRIGQEGVFNCLCIRLFV